MAKKSKKGMSVEQIKSKIKFLPSYKLKIGYLNNLEKRITVNSVTPETRSNFFVAFGDEYVANFARRYKISDDIKNESDLFELNKAISNYIKKESDLFELNKAIEKYSLAINSLAEINPSNSIKRKELMQKVSGLKIEILDKSADLIDYNCYLAINYGKLKDPLNEIDIVEKALLLKVDEYKSLNHKCGVKKMFKIIAELYAYMIEHEHTLKGEELYKKIFCLEKAGEYFSLNGEKNQIDYYFEYAADLLIEDTRRFTNCVENYMLPKRAAELYFKAGRFEKAASAWKIAGYAQSRWKPKEAIICYANAISLDKDSVDPDFLLEILGQDNAIQVYKKVDKIKTTNLIN